MITAKSEPGFAAVTHKRFGEISCTGRFSKELRLVEWGVHPPKFDIRPWDTADEMGTRCQKGITLTLEEIQKLKEILDSLQLEGFVIPDKKIEPIIR